ncbi:DNA repair protein complementing XP-C cells homolog [Anopheles aquasalis]|uniref:DNA repair protein complementing XP-C cells homolog n=1 Tax=Anopheles aquasalis TaxID=42839 RepID=UPI00215B0D20|nr:DNA repair protein complementing XP-C cells homolog [Anopheles aquasalis]
MNPLPRGRLKRLLARDGDNQKQTQDIKRSNKSVETVVQCSEPSSVPVNVDGSQLNAAKESHDYPVPCDNEEGSDSDASSVGDHLVNPDELDLDGTFFTQSSEKGVPACTAESDEETPKNIEATYESCTESDTNSEDEVPQEESNEKMYQIFSQIVDFDRQLNAANHARCLTGPRSSDSYTESTSNVVPYEGLDVGMMLTQIEGAAARFYTSEEIDRNWENVESHTNLSADDDRKEIEILVSTTQHKPGRIIDVAQSLRRLEQEKRKKEYLDQHKVHLIMLLSHGTQVNWVINDCLSEYAEELLELAQNCPYPLVDKINQDFVQSIVDHFHAKVQLSSTKPKRKCIKVGIGIGKQLRSREASSRKMFNLLLLALLRFLSVRTRLVFCLDVIPKNPPAPKVNKKVLPKPGTLSATHGRYGKVPLTTTEILKQKPEIRQIFQLPQLDGADEEDDAQECVSPSKSACSNCPEHKPRLWKLKASSEAPIKPNCASNDRHPNKIVTSKFFKKKVHKSQLLKPKVDSTNSITAGSSKLARLLQRKPPAESSKSKKIEANPKIPELDTWLECFLEQEERWTVVEATLGVDCLEQVMDCILSPPAYVFAWEAGGAIVDVVERYSWRNEMASRKQRVDRKWLQKCLNRHRLRSQDVAYAVDQREFRQLKFRAPMPTTIAQFKNHPSYCLKRDLQKFQAIYPPDAPPLGFIHGEAIYARECVQTLHSREVWLRHAKVIRLQEQPYKIVKSKLRRVQIMLELFGYWQTEDYVPPEPVNGIVPRNAYGNIEIFKDCMLPKGTVHLKHYGLSHICRKLGIDYAVAVVGFGIHAGGNHPVFDGIVICEEHRDRLLEAWEEHQLDSEHRKREKKQQKVLAHWVKLVKGVLVRNRLKHKYNFEGM